MVEDRSDEEETIGGDFEPFVHRPVPERSPDRRGLENGRRDIPDGRQGRLYDRTARKSGKTCHERST